MWVWNDMKVSKQERWSEFSFVGELTFKIHKSGLFLSLVRTFLQAMKKLGTTLK